MKKTRKRPDKPTKPIPIKTFETPPKSRKAFGLIKTDSIPKTMIERVYIIRFRISVAVTIPIGMPSLVIKKALAGCPPVADGVMAEK
jgi:hypothetical protein